ncbi:fimbrial biogenesis outer membrane usher protein [Serratia fonticola]|uniref:fimbria/pilus outer membrane usher protein n=1 Tax=Serratia fonticola TaxID=47917 RepID=UPI0015C628D3|nr:fimbria/pilus outer membrane usher protein [Serratia fonticola]MBC3378697.1 fimbrial biogenesis outer membrane usher protein [Serratia fonticola]NYA37897.1 fimbrial biogenesis outer membrane usher protein [Serratia fonticola]
MSTYLQQGRYGRLSPLAIAVLSAFFAGSTHAETTKTSDVPQEVAKNLEFDASFLNVDDEKSVDLSRFANGSSGLPGVYKTALYINSQLNSNTDIEFKARADKSVYPCLTRDLIKNIAFNYAKLPADFLASLDKGDACFDLQQRLPEAQVNYDSNEQRLDIVIPQIYMLNTARGTVSPELWDSGVPALLLGYNVNGYTSDSHGSSYNSLFAGVNAGVNVGAWYLRHNGSYSRMSDGESQYNNINTYMQRDIPVLKARVLMGQSNTTGQLFDTLPFTGVQLASDERMLPESLRGYAPDIRGIARTNARVTVRQNGQVLYETTVTPGEFLINDLYPTGYGGNLDVTVRESDGTEQTFSVPYASVAQLLRPGSSRYSITAGEVRSDSLREKPALYQATYQLGLTNTVTGYGGLQASQDYYALQLGTAVGTPIGALAFDVTQAGTQLDNSTDANGRHQPGNLLSGQSYQVSYSKLISETNSNLSLAAYRFSTDGYMDFMTAMQTRDAVAKGYSPESISRAKNRLTVTAGQGLPENWGQLYISGSLQNYWNKDGSEKQYQLGYNNRYKSLSYGLSVNRSFSSLGTAQTNYLLSFSLPLGSNDRQHIPQLRMDLSHDSSGRYGQQATVSGTAGQENQFSYGVTAMNANQGQGSSGSLNGNYRTPATALSGSYSTGKGYHSASAGMNGTVIGHAGGVTFTPYTSDTFALVEAKGAEGAKVSSYPGVSIDSRGYAVVPYLNPYQMNEISIDPKGTAANVELDNTNQKVAPYSGAVVKVKYTTKTGTPILVNATYQGEPVPFGADIFDGKGNSVGTVGQGGQLYARVAQDKGQLRVKWGEGGEMQCTVSYMLMPMVKGQQPSSIQQFNTACTPTLSTAEGTRLTKNDAASMAHEG